EYRLSLPDPQRPPDRLTILEMTLGQRPADDRDSCGTRAILRREFSAGDEPCAQCPKRVGTDELLGDGGMVKRKRQSPFGAVAAVRRDLADRSHAQITTDCGDCAEGGLPLPF